MKVLIRKMTPGDLDAVLAIEQRVFPDPWQRTSFEFEVSHNRFSYPVVLEVEGEVIGYAVAWEIFEEFHIANIAIHPAHQKKGWGTLLLQHLIDRARKCQSHYILLEVRPSNTAALALYRKLGFSPSGVRKRYYRDGEDAILMRKNLQQPNPTQTVTPDINEH